MNKRQLTIQRMKVYKSYHIPGCSSYMKRPKNAVYIRPQNSLRHELKKAEICWDLIKRGKMFITEAQHNVTGKIRDIVVLDTGLVIEIETTKKGFERRQKEGVEVVKA